MKMFKKISILLTILAVAFTLGLAGLIGVRAATTINLGTAGNFSVLAGSSIVDSNISNIISGDVGLSPGTSFGALTSAEVAGTIYAVDATGPDGAAGNNPGLLTTAKNDLTAAYIAAGQPTTGVIAADLGGQTLLAGVYDDNDAPDSLSLTGTLTLNAQGDPNAVFIFKTGSTLTTAAASRIDLINGAQACNVFWQIGSSATLGTGTLFKGNLMALASITDNGGSTVEGRLLARNGAVTLNNTTVTRATCVTPPVPIPPSGGGNAPVSVPPLISVTKIPTPLSLPAGPGSVTYDYTVLNIGTVAMSNVTVADNKCPIVTFVSGDTDNDTWLDTTETWMYRCTTTLALTTTNTVTATGFSDGNIAIDTANATVVVSLPIIPPLIHIVKVPNPLTLPAGGGAVTYNYTITNPGTAPLNNVSVIDNKCTGLPGRVLGHPGDLNQNNLLESNESWSFTCQTNIAQTVTNTATAEGSANGLTAIDFALATVVVAPPVIPLLPNTGVAPAQNNIPWFAVMASILMLVSVSLIVVLKKRTS